MYHRRDYSTTGSSFFPTIKNRFIHRDLERDWRMDIPFPPVNVVKEEEVYKVCMAAPGMKKDQFFIKVVKGRLIITGEKKTSMEEKTDEYIHQEYDFHSFKRMIPLPKGVKVDSVMAEYENGILCVSLPYEKEDKDVKLIPVSEAK